MGRVVQVPNRPSTGPIYPDSAAPKTQDFQLLIPVPLQAGQSNGITQTLPFTPGGLEVWNFSDLTVLLDFGRLPTLTNILGQFNGIGAPQSVSTYRWPEEYRDSQRWSYYIQGAHHGPAGMIVIVLREGFVDTEINPLPVFNAPEAVFEENYGNDNLASGATDTIVFTNNIMQYSVSSIPQVSAGSDAAQPLQVAHSSTPSAPYTYDPAYYIAAGQSVSKDVVTTSLTVKNMGAVACSYQVQGLYPAPYGI